MEQLSGLGGSLNLSYPQFSHVNKMITQQSVSTVPTRGKDSVNVT